MHRILFQIGPITLYSYGLLVGIGFLLASMLVLRDSKRFGLPRDSIFDCLIAVLLGGIIGGRLLFVALNWDYFFRQPLKVFMLNEGGMAFHGALVVAVAAGALTARIKGLSFWKVSDLFAPYIALGHGIGRIGCFLNGCCYGRVLESGIGVVFPGEAVVRVPTQIYSSLFLIMLYIVLLFIRERGMFDGCVFSMYVILYSIFRFVIEFFRGDSQVLFLGLTLAQIISLAMLLCGIAMYRFLSRRPYGW